MLRCVFLLCSVLFSSLALGSSWTLHEDVLVSTPEGSIRAVELLEPGRVVIHARSNGDSNDLGFTAEVLHAHEQMLYGKKFVMFEIVDFEQIKVGSQWTKEQLVEGKTPQVERLRNISLSIGGSGKVARFMMPLVLMAAMVPGADAGGPFSTTVCSTVCALVNNCGCAAGALILAPLGPAISTLYAAACGTLVQTGGIPRANA